MTVKEIVVPHSGHISLTQSNYHYLGESGEILFLPWYVDAAPHTDICTVAVWYRKGYKKRDMKPSDWDQMDYPNNINS